MKKTCMFFDIWSLVALVGFFAIPQELEITRPSKTPDEIPPETVEETKIIPSDDIVSELNVTTETVVATKTIEKIEDKVPRW